MMDELRLTAVMWKAGQHLTQRLQSAVDDPATTTVTLDRDEALLALAIIAAAVETLEKGGGKSG